MGSNCVRLDQRHVVDEEAQDALALAGIDARVLPDSRQLLREIENAAAHVCIEYVCFLSTASLEVYGGVSMKTQLVVPFRFEGIGDEAVVGVDLHVSSTGEFGLVSQPLDMLAAQGVGLGSACFKFALNLQTDRQGHGRRHLDQQGCDRRIDDLAGNRLACLSGAPHRGLLTDVDRDSLAILSAVMHTHALTAQTTQHATLQQGRSLPRGPCKRRSNNPSLKRPDCLVAPEQNSVRR